MSSSTNVTSFCRFVPFHIELRRLTRDGDTLSHELGFGVVGVAKPARVVVASDCYYDPVVAKRLDRGGLDLPDALLDLLAIKCFKLISGPIIEHDGESGRWTIADASRWVRGQFPPEDALRVLKELSWHVQPGVTARDVCLVADDDAI